MAGITVNVALYGSIAQFAGKKHLAQLDLEFENGARFDDLLNHLDIPKEEKGYVFINAVLCDVPGLNAAREEPLHDGDHVGIFSTTHMWPYQYRDGARMSDRLKEALGERGAMHHSYQH